MRGERAGSTGSSTARWMSSASMSASPPPTRPVESSSMNCCSERPRSRPSPSGACDAKSDASWLRMPSPTAPSRPCTVDAPRCCASAPSRGSISTRSPSTPRSRSRDIASSAPPPSPPPPPPPPPPRSPRPPPPTPSAASSSVSSVEAGGLTSACCAACCSLGHACSTSFTSSASEPSKLLRSKSMSASARGGGGPPARSHSPANSPRKSRRSSRPRRIASAAANARSASSTSASSISASTSGSCRRPRPRPCPCPCPSSPPAPPSPSAWPWLLASSASVSRYATSRRAGARGWPAAAPSSSASKTPRPLRLDRPLCCRTLLLRRAAGCGSSGGSSTTTTARALALVLALRPPVGAAGSAVRGLASLPRRDLPSPACCASLCLLDWPATWLLLSACACLLRSGLRLGERFSSGSTGVLTGSEVGPNMPSNGATRNSYHVSA